MKCYVEDCTKKAYVVATWTGFLAEEYGKELPWCDEHWRARAAKQSKDVRLADSDPVAEFWKEFHS